MKRRISPADHRHTQTTVHCRVLIISTHLTLPTPHAEKSETEHKFLQKKKWWQEAARPCSVTLHHKAFKISPLAKYQTSTEGNYWYVSFSNYEYISREYYNIYHVEWRVSNLYCISAAVHVSYSGVATRHRCPSVVPQHTRFCVYAYMHMKGQRWMWVYQGH